MYKDVCNFIENILKSYAIFQISRIVLPHYDVRSPAIFCTDSPESLHIYAQIRVNSIPGKFTSAFLYIHIIVWEKFNEHFIYPIFAPMHITPDIKIIFILRQSLCQTPGLDPFSFSVLACCVTPTDPI